MRKKRIITSKKIGENPIHKVLQELSLNDLYGVTMLIVYMQVQWVMKDQFIQKEKPVILSHQIWMTSLLKKSAILKWKYYNPKNLIVQHLPGKERGNKIELNRMRNDYIVDTLTPVYKKLLRLGER